MAVCALTQLVIDSLHSLLVFQATACLPSLVDKENHQPLALRLKDSRREPEKVVKDPGKVQLSQREPKAPSILRRCKAN